MGQTAPTSQTHTQHAMASRHDNFRVSICIPLGSALLQCKPLAPLVCKVEAHVTPGACETWAPHTASGYYIGNAWKHYCCHEVYISDTKSICTCLIVFFKHKYLTMPSLTPLDALIRAADNLTDAISGLIPTSTVIADALDQLMETYKQQARAIRDAATAQRVLRECAQAERVIKE
jgi:hypothetical protein